MLIGFVPWIVYWMLVGNVPTGVSALVALAVALAAFGVGRAGRQSRTGVIEIGAVATFFVLTALAFTADAEVVQRWLPPLADAGLLAVAAVSVLAGRPFVRPYVAAGLPADIVKTETFGRIVAVLSWLWVAAAAAMTVSAVIAPLLGARPPLSYLCSWVVPAVLFAVATLASKLVPDRMLVGIDDVARKTTFVAFAEAEIDQLIYLAQEHANREVGPGKEAYNVRIGGKGTPLVGDDTRQSWPSTYKVRDKRR